MQETMCTSVETKFAVKKFIQIVIELEKENARTKITQVNSRAVNLRVKVKSRIK